MQTFADVTGEGVYAEGEQGIIPRTNFNTIGNSILTCFEILTGEDWVQTMYSAGRLDPVMSIIYFMLFYVFINYMLLEMMVALIVEQSQLSETKREAMQFEYYVKGFLIRLCTSILTLIRCYRSAKQGS